MGSDWSRSRLGYAGLTSIYSGSQLQANGALPLTAFFLLSAGEVCEARSDRQRVSNMTALSSLGSSETFLLYLLVAD